MACINVFIDCIIFFLPASIRYYMAVWNASGHGEHSAQWAPFKYLNKLKFICSLKNGYI